MDEAGKSGFRAEVLEKVIQLLNLLEQLNRHPFLKGKFALKGGTALNLFLFDLPRLSVDIDLNYIGEVDRESMLTERQLIEQAIVKVCLREDLNVVRTASEHAGGKWKIRYKSFTGSGGNLEVDLNYMFRVPLWPVCHTSAKVGMFSANEIPILDLHEIAAGKMAALLARNAGRDLFDTVHIFTKLELDHVKLRLAFLLYGAMNRKDWRTVSVEDISCDKNELSNQLLPVVRRKFIDENNIMQWAESAVDTCRNKMAELLRFSENERLFFNELLDSGNIKPELITDNEDLAKRIANHPSLLWKALNVKQHKTNADVKE